MTKLASYTNPITPAQANDQDFTQNQQLVLDNKALFMPNGTWIVGEICLLYTSKAGDLYESERPTH